MNKLLKYSFAVSVTSALFCAMMAIIPASVALASTTALTGFAWSSTIGWISFSGSTATTSYAVNMDNTTGALSGYAWSNNLGWISFNSSDVSGCPNGSCNPTVNMTTGTVTGWARALTLSSDQHDGTGWISLHGPTGTSTASYGVAYNTTTGQFSGYAWSSDIIGWMQWYIGPISQGTPSPSPSPNGCGSGGGCGCNPAQGVCGPGNGGTTPTLTCGLIPSSSYTPSGSVPVSGGTVTLNWTSANATSCSGSGSGFTTGGATSGSQNITATPNQSFGLTCINSSYPALQCTSNALIGTAGAPATVNMWLDNNPSQTSALIHPSDTVTVNWNDSQFYNQYPPSDNPTCVGGTVSGTPISTWDSMSQSLTPNPTNALSIPGGVLSSGVYGLNLKCTAIVAGVRTPPIYSNPVYITVTTGAIHEQ